jgi:RNA polymerase sigma-70 factor (ECF subfamily)
MPIQSLPNSCQTDTGELVSQQFRRILIRSVLPIVRECAEAEDVVQQALLHAFEHVEQFEGKAKFSTWLSRIALTKRWAGCAEGAP